MTGHHTAFPSRWADRKVKAAGTREARGTPWTEPQLKWLEEMCLTTLSYGDIANEYSKAFPDSRRTRNAVIGRATRSGLRDAKPQTMKAKGRPRTRVMRKVKYAGQETRRERRAALAPVVFKPALRDDNEPILRQSGPHTMKRKTPDQIAKARKGYLPCIIEEAPLTSVAMEQTAADCCKWPTSEDVTCMEVCGEPAEYGAYCERHAMIAYREMPTRRRNASYARKGMLDDQQRQRDRDARMIEELEVEEAPMLAVDPAPLMIPHFTDDAS